MEYSKLQYYTSKDRLGRFLSACEGNKTKACELYFSNIEVSKAFYPVLSQFEIFLRNVIYQQLVLTFNDFNWIINQKSGFMSDRSLERSNYFLKRSIESAERAITRSGGTVTPGKLIAEQSFGFWTSLFQTHHYKLIKGSSILCFSNKPPQISRKEIYLKLNNIRKFRNRVYHNEPICFTGSIIDYSSATQIQADIYKLLTWIDKDLSDYISKLDSVSLAIKKNA